MSLFFILSTLITLAAVALAILVPAWKLLAWLENNARSMYRAYVARRAIALDQSPR